MVKKKEREGKYFYISIQCSEPLCLKFPVIAKTENPLALLCCRRHGIPMHAGVHLHLERGHPARRPPAHQEVLLRCRLPHQPRHPLRLPQHEGQPAMEVPQSKTGCGGGWTGEPA